MGWVIVHPQQTAQTPVVQHRTDDRLKGKIRAVVLKSAHYECDAEGTLYPVRMLPYYCPRDLNEEKGSRALQTNRSPEGGKTQCAYETECALSAIWVVWVSRRRAVVEIPRAEYAAGDYGCIVPVRKAVFREVKGEVVDPLSHPGLQLVDPVELLNDNITGITSYQRPIASASVVVQQVLAHCRRRLDMKGAIGRRSMGKGDHLRSGTTVRPPIHI